MPLTRHVSDLHFTFLQSPAATAAAGGVTHLAMVPSLLRLMLPALEVSSGGGVDCPFL